MQADPEHEQDHADLGQLRDEVDVAHEAGRVRPHGDAGQQVTDQGRQAEAPGQHAECEGKDKAESNGRDQRWGVGHGPAPR
jgi:hypothetical protein